MKEINSLKNAMVKETKKLHQKKYRNQTNQYLLDGLHLIQEAIAAHAEVFHLFVTEKGAAEAGSLLEGYSDQTYLISEEIAKSLSDLPTPQGIFAVVKKTIQTPELKGQWLILDNVQDPGNVGTMVRTADAAGFSGVFLGVGTADPYSTKVLRSMQGSNFHLPVIEGEITDFIKRLREHDFKIYGTELNDKAVVYSTIFPAENCGIIMGNEGQGVAPELLALTDQNLYIPILGAAESLNVGVAAGIIMYHMALQELLRNY